jgi:hypothetical protein
MEKKMRLSLRAQSEIHILLQVLVSPVLAGLAVGIGVPILLFYVYGVVPVSLCRSGAGVSFVYDDDENDILGVLGARNTGKIHDRQKYVQTDHFSLRLYNSCGGTMKPSSLSQTWFGVCQGKLLKPLHQVYVCV